MICICLRPVASSHLPLLLEVESSALVTVVDVTAILAHPVALPVGIDAGLFLGADLGLLGTEHVQGGGRSGDLSERGQGARGPSGIRIFKSSRSAAHNDTGRDRMSSSAIQCPVDLRRGYGSQNLDYKLRRVRPCHLLLLTFVLTAAEGLRDVLGATGLNAVTLTTRHRKARNDLKSIF